MLKTRLEKFYEKVVCEDFVLLYNMKNLYTLPVFEKAILNTTCNRFVSEKEALLQSFSAFFLQTGKLPLNTRAQNSIALFNIRQGNILGLKTTLRKKGLYNYLDKALIFVIPKSHSTTSLQKPIENQLVSFSSTSPLIKLKARLTTVDASTKTKKEVFNEKTNKYNALLTTQKSDVSRLNENRDFVISDKEVTRFPEVSSLLLFFDSTTGFSLDCLLSLYGQKRLSKLKHSPKVITCSKISRKSKEELTQKRKDIGCEKKNRFISAFGFPQPALTKYLLS